jgi:hypothetical protein
LFKLGAVRCANSERHCYATQWHSYAVSVAPSSGPWGSCHEGLVECAPRGPSRGESGGVVIAESMRIRPGLPVRFQIWPVHNWQVLASAGAGWGVSRCPGSLWPGRVTPGGPAGRAWEPRASEASESGPCARGRPECGKMIELSVSGQDERAKPETRDVTVVFEVGPGAWAVLSAGT